MFHRNRILGTHRWSCLAIVLTGWIVFSSCASLTVSTTDSASASYKEIKTIAEILENNDDPDAYEVLIKKSTAFINAHPKHKRVDEIYYLLGKSLLQCNRTEDGIEILKQLIKYYPSADYVEPSLLILGLAYDKVDEHYKADQLYEKLADDTKYRGGRFSNIAQQLLEQDWDARTGELANSAGASPAPSPSQFINRPALDFQVTDLSGETLSLTQYRGQVVLLDFWATWCGPCIAEMPNVKKTYAKYKDQKFEIIGISLDNSPAPLEEYIASERIAWRQYWDNGAKITQLYNVRAIPSTFLIDGEGTIREVNLRGIALENAVAELVKENLGN